MLQNQLLTPENTTDDEKAQPLGPGRRVDSRDRDLQLSRRLDWRFLLPNPHLQRVAYLDPKRGTLLEALQRFSDSLTVISTTSRLPTAPEDQYLFDLVVLRSGSPAHIGRVSPLLKAGGYLYWEIDRMSRLRSLFGITRQDGSVQSRSLTQYQDCVVVLERLGFCDVEAYWHCPNFEECLELIPLSDRSVLEYFFSRTRSGFAGQLKLTAGRYLMKAGLLPGVVPCFSILACKRVT